VQYTCIVLRDWCGVGRCCECGISSFVSFNVKSNQVISETADSKIQDNDNVQPLTEVRKGCLLPALTSDLTGSDFPNVIATNID